MLREPGREQREGKGEKREGGCCLLPGEGSTGNGFSPLYKRPAVFYGDLIGDLHLPAPFLFHPWHSFCAGQPLGDSD